MTRPRSTTAMSDAEEKADLDWLAKNRLPPNDAAIRRLFQAVLLQAIADACMQELAPLPRARPLLEKPGKRVVLRGRDLDEWWADRVEDRRARNREIRLERDLARTWLLGGGDGFALVCEGAGWEPAYIARGVAQLESRGWRPDGAEIINTGASAVALARRPMARNDSGRAA